MNAEYKAIEDKLYELDKVAAEVGYQIKWVIEPFVECNITQEELDWSNFMDEEMAREEQELQEMQEAENALQLEKENMPPGQVQWYMEEDKKYRDKH